MRSKALIARPLFQKGARSGLDHMHVFLRALKSTWTTSAAGTATSWQHLTSAAWPALETQRLCITRYAERSVWRAAVMNVETVDFGGIAPPCGAKHFNRPRGLTRRGVKFLGRALHPGAHHLVVASAMGNPYVSCWGDDDKLHGGGVEIQVFFPSGATAIGMDVMITSQAFHPSRASFTVTLSTGEVFAGIPSTPPPRRSFFGLVSDRPIDSLRLVSDNTFPMLGNFSFGRRS